MKQPSHYASLKPLIKRLEKRLKPMKPEDKAVTLAGAMHFRYGCAEIGIPDAIWEHCSLASCPHLRGEFDLVLIALSGMLPNEDEDVTDFASLWLFTASAIVSAEKRFRKRIVALWRQILAGDALEISKQRFRNMHPDRIFELPHIFITPKLAQ